MNKKSLIIYVVAFAAVIAVSVWAYNYISDTYVPEETPEAVQSQAKQPASDFTVEDGNGNSVKLSSFKGKPVVVNFWASWCGPCKMEFPAFEKMYNEYGENIEFLMVNMTDGQRETVETAKSFVADSSYSFPVYYDTNLSAAYTYYVNSIPMTLFIDSDGNLINYHKGAMSEEMLKKYVSLITEAE